MYIKTDDWQYVNKVKDGVYKCVEGRYAEDKYLLCTNTVIIANWLDSEGNYDANCISIIEAYYDSVKDFENQYVDIEFREQVLAEMIFENTSYYECETWRLVSEQNIEMEIENIIREEMNM